MRQAITFVIDNFDFDAKNRAPLLTLKLVLLFFGQLRHDRVHRINRTDRAGFGHTPGMNQEGIVLLIKVFDHLQRCCSTTNDDVLH